MQAGRVLRFLKEEIVLVIACGAALLSMLAVPPNAGYFSYIDASVLGILFCLMAVIAGLGKLGVFEIISRRLLAGCKNVRTIAVLLVGASFFLAMLVTNDVALLTFVPLTIGLLGTQQQKRLVYILVLETMAANVGSMLTPVGNPQNLFLYSFYQMGIVEFLRAVAPVCAVGFVILIAMALLVPKSAPPVCAQQAAVAIGKKQLLGYTLLFLLCISTVLHAVDYRVCLVIVILGVFCMDKSIFKAVDYSLLLTFVAFFIFVGNLGSISSVKAFVSAFIRGREMTRSILISQIISNVPAALMLSGFTSNGRALLLGVNIGGLGTLVASLASLISFKLYAKSKNARPGYFFCVFTLCNVLVLALLTGASYFLS